MDNVAIVMLEKLKAESPDFENLIAFVGDSQNYHVVDKHLGEITLLSKEFDDIVKRLYEGAFIETLIRAQRGEFN